MNEQEKTMIKAYKGFDKNLQCRGYQYEVGGEQLSQTVSVAMIVKYAEQKSRLERE